MKNKIKIDKPCRSMISVPGHKGKMHEKAVASNVDVIMLDLEDSVPADQKEAARKTVINSLLSLDFNKKRVNLRINRLDTPFAYKDLILVSEAACDHIDTIVVPKVNHEGDIHFVSRLLDGVETALGQKRPLRIQACIETAQGLFRIKEIAQADSRLSSLSFGIADYQASIGAGLVSLSGHGENEEQVYPGHRWHFQISRIVMAAKANGLVALDAPYGNFRDPDGLKKSADLAKALGCDGKWVIHPDQIDTVNQVFTPSDEEIQRARQILEAADDQSRGAVAVDGRMVDLATIRIAQRVWDQAVFLGRN
ncbi:HpcH/HpaI aldolase/citrate lyase family protein [Desulfobacter latus]|uniref:CoA ester lyase n=1 Tax=Desulfobacter latus TaxID=2292 RepID=A0A850SWF5_9BACT|nr:CoA ester lyase [Desulfobacter latus]NWH03753.1 CoA ester lyase [Desulfobacter latus]